MTYRFIPGISDTCRGLILFDPEQYDIVQAVLEQLDSYDFELSTSTAWIHAASESHFKAFIKLFEIKLQQLDRIPSGG